MTNDNAIVAPRAPASRSLAEREAKRVVKLHVSLVTEIDTCINEIFSDEEMKARWIKHADPIFDEESQEGSVDIDKIRLADLVREWATIHKDRFIRIYGTRTNVLKNAVQRALSRTDESVSKRRAQVHAVYS